MTEINNLIRFFKGDTQISELARLVFNAAVWFIWQERNDRIFNKVSTHKTNIFKQLEDVILVWLASSTKFCSDSAIQLPILLNWN